MYRKCFFKNKGVLSRRFVASGLAAVFSAGMFGSYAGAMRGSISSDSDSIIINKEVTNNLQDNKLLNFVLNEPTLEQDVKRLEDKRWILENFFDQGYINENFEELKSVIPNHDEILGMYIADFCSIYKNVSFEQLKKELKDNFSEQLQMKWKKKLM